MILKELRKTSSKIEKEEILKKADSFDKRMFTYAYDPNLVYNLKFNYVHWDGIRQPSQLDFILLDRILRKELWGNGAREAIQAHCNEHGDLVKLICNKDLDCGVTGTTLNKVFGKGFIPLFEVQLAVEVPLEKLTLPLIGQIKYNGVRVIAYIRKGDVTFRTRNGKHFEFPKLADLLSQGYKCSDRDMILDGELCYLDSKGHDHTGISGIVNSAIKGNPIKDIRGDIVFNVFDCLEAHHFFNQICVDNYANRFTRLENYVTCLWGTMDREATKHIQVAKSFLFNSYEDIQNKYDELLEEGYEGLILKSHSHLYTYKRSADWVKMKAIKTADIKVVDIQDGTGKYINAIGALVCEGEVEGRPIKVKVGSGLSDAQRFYDPNEFLGSTIEVKYNTVIRDKDTNEWSLFLPRFVTIRGDK